MPVPDALQDHAQHAGGEIRPAPPATSAPAGLSVADQQRRLLDFVSCGSDWFWETDSEFQVRWISDEFFVLTGLRPEEVIGKPRQQFGFDHIVPSAEELADLVRRREPIREIITRGILPDGREMWSRAAAVPILDADNQFTGYRGATTDITELMLARHEVEEREQRFRDYASAASDWFWESDAELRITDISDAFLAATGFRREEVLGRTRSELGFEAVNPEAERGMAVSVAAHRPYRNVVSKGIMPNGRKLWVQASGVPIFDQAGRFRGYRGVTADVSEHLEGEQALRQSEQRLRDFLDSSSDWLWEMGPDLRFTYISERVEEFTGWPVSHFLGHTRAMAGSTDSDQEAWRQHLRDLEQRRPFRDFEFANQKPDGSLHWVTNSGKPVFSASGTFLGYRGSARDITAEKLSELRLREFAALVRHSSDAVISATPDGIITSWNPAAERLYAVPAQDALGRDIAFLASSEEDRRVQDEVFQKVLAGQVAQGVEVRRRQPNGSLAVLSLTISPICDDNDKVAGLSAIVRDISESKRAEAKIAAQRDELEDLNRQKDQLFSIIAHDLRSPFNVILGFSELLEQSAADFDAETIARYSAMVHNAGNTAYRLLENLLDWSRMQMGQNSFSREPLDVGTVLARNAALLQPLAVAKGIELDWSAPADLIMYADSKMIDTVLRNLIGNAVKFTDAGGVVSATAERNGDHIELSISDTGIGMSIERLAKLFQLSEHLSTNGTSGEKGSGLGLLLCKEMVDNHDGYISVESTVGEGTTFCVSLPQALPAEPAVA